MDRPTARRLARALIAPATQHIPDEHLEATLDLAEHLYRARAGTLTYLSAVAQRDAIGTDDTGDYTDIRLAGLSRELADPRTTISIAGSQPRWKLRNATPTLTYIRVYADIPDGAASMGPRLTTRNNRTRCSGTKTHCFLHSLTHSTLHIWLRSCILPSPVAHLRRLSEPYPTLQGQLPSVSAQPTPGNRPL